MNWSIALANDTAIKVNGGTVFTSADIDYTIKVLATGLSPQTEYMYAFEACDGNARSTTGITRTLPAPDDEVTAANNITLAVYAGAHYAWGHFNAYLAPVFKTSADYVVHLGNYLYEVAEGADGDGGAINRTLQPRRECYTLRDYRQRHALYKTDASLQLNHAHAPWIAVWNDGESGENAWRDGFGTLGNDEEGFDRDGVGMTVETRKANAVRAYWEYMPLRQVDVDDGLRIWRRFRFGRLFDLFMLDTRLYDRSVGVARGNERYVEMIKDDDARSLMGQRQESWLYSGLRDSYERGARWRVIASQVVFSEVDFPEGPDYEGWDGYTKNRERLLNVLETGGITNNVVLSGDARMVRFHYHLGLICSTPFRPIPPLSPLLLLLLLLFLLLHHVLPSH